MAAVVAAGDAGYSNKNPESVVHGRGSLFTSELKVPNVVVESVFAGRGEESGEPDVNSMLTKLFLASSIIIVQSSPDKFRLIADDT